MINIFDDTKTAFSLKSDNQIKKAYYLFKIIGNTKLVKVGTFLINLALKLNLPIQGLIKFSVFEHFCGGISENDCVPVIDKMFLKGVSSVLDYSVEGKKDEIHFDDALQTTLNIILFANLKKAIPFVVFKPSGFGRFGLYQKISEFKLLTDNEKNEWSRVVVRFDKVCHLAEQNKISILIDSEESWMQNAADQLVEQMMQKYNKNSPVVFNTLQMYRWDKLDYLKNLHKKALKENFQIGIKLVRGAYLEKENTRARQNFYVSPICSSKFATDINFNNASNYIMQHLNKFSIFLGTHNEDSCYKLIEAIQNLNIPNNDSRVWFGQLYGMSDNISFNLASNGYNVAKYLPFGPIKEVMPYLIRRAQENTSVAGQTNREMSLLQTEIYRRKANKN